MFIWGTPLLLYGDCRGKMCWTAPRALVSFCVLKGFGLILAADAHLSISLFSSFWVGFDVQRAHLADTPH